MTPPSQLTSAALALLSLVPLAAAQTATASLSQARWRMAATTVDDLALFAGGASCAQVPTPPCPSAVVDAFDAGTGLWATGSLSQARVYVGATTVGGRAFFAGGWRDQISLPTDVIDIYDPALGAPGDPAAWSTSALSSPRGFVAAATLGDLAFFAGGAGAAFSNTVDVYDASQGTWSVAHLSFPRSAICAVQVGQKVVFAGGIAGLPSDVVDIYDASRGAPTDPAAWSSTTLSQPRALVAGAAVGGKALFAGGATSGVVTSDVVDIYDAATDTWSTASLSEARRYVAAAACGDRVFFAGSDRGHNAALAPVVDASDVVDVYDVVADSWSTTTLSAARVVGAATAVGDRVVLAGGADPTGTLATVDLLEAGVGARYCSPGAPNSTGAAGRIAATGSRTIAENSLELTATDLPASSFGFFLTSRGQGLVMQPGQSQGILCLGGSIGRYVGPGEIQFSGTAGAFSLSLDLTTMPTPTGFAAVQPGETWNFQAWYRDANPTATSNFTDAMSVSFP